MTLDTVLQSRMGSAFGKGVMQLCHNTICIYLYLSAEVVASYYIRLGEKGLRKKP